MTSIYLINPETSAENVLRTLKAKVATKTADETVVLRFPDSLSHPISRSQIKVRNTSTKRVYDDINASPIKFQSMNPAQEACIEMLRSVMDVDISLPTGFTIFEVPLGANDYRQIEPDCFLTMEDLFNYLVAANAKPPERTTRRDEDIGDRQWEGVESSAADGFLESTMVFEASYHYIRVTTEDAINYLTATLTHKEYALRKLEMSDVIKVKIYVIPNDPCIIPIIREHPLSTVPVSKQRLLYIYDRIHDWLRDYQQKWVSMKLNTNASNRDVSFQYKIEHMAKGWTRLPELIVTPQTISRDLSLPGSPCWNKFMPKQTGEATLLPAMQAVVMLLQEFGIDMSVNDFAGTVTDYTSDRKNFKLPVRETTIPAAAREVTNRKRGKSSGPHERKQSPRRNQSSPRKQEPSVLATRSKQDSSRK